MTAIRINKINCISGTFLGNKIKRFELNECSVETLEIITELIFSLFSVTEFRLPSRILFGFLCLSFDLN